MTITSDDVREQLITVDQLAEELGKTEPLEDIEFGVDSDSEKMRWQLPLRWNMGMKEAPGVMLTAATVNLKGKEYQLTKDALLQATSSIGLQRDYVLKTPGPMVEEHLNYWLNQYDKTRKLLVTSDTALAVTKGTVTPISNVSLLEVAMKGLREEYGADAEILVDYKRHHDLRRTNFRLVVPEKQRVMKSARAETDAWSLGLDVQNSLTVESPTKLRGYMFAWFCTNGQTSTHASSGSYSRKGSPSAQEALLWAEASVEGVLGGLEHELDNIEALVDMPIEGNVTTTLHDIFDRYKVPAGARQGIIEQLVENDDLSMYGVLAAITQAANHGGMSPQIVSRLLEIGGDLPSQASGRCESCHRLPVT